MTDQLRNDALKQKPEHLQKHHIVEIANFTDSVKNSVHDQQEEMKVFTVHLLHFLQLESAHCNIND